MPEERKIYKSFHELSPREYMYFPKGTIDVSKPGSFSRIEIQHLLISILVLTVAFAFALSGNNLIEGSSSGFRLDVLPYAFAAAFLGIITGFFFHELSHKFMAQKYGLWAEYRMFPQGIGLALMLGLLTPFVFAAPGAVMFQGGSRIHETGRIAMAGPFANIIIAVITYPMFLITINISTTIGSIVGFICFINALLATFNLFPIEPLDGVKIIRWNATVWIIMLIAAFFMFALMMPRLTTII